MSKIVYKREALTGGGTALDGISVADLTSGDMAFVKSGGHLYYLEYDSSGTAAENTTTHPYVIRPDDYATGGNWTEIYAYAEAVSFVSHGATEAANAADMYGQIHRVTGAYTVTIPTAVVGMSALFEATTAAAFSVKAGASNHIILRGTTLDHGDKITSSGAIGASVLLYCADADYWIANIMNDYFTDGGA